ncbi:Flp pilus assembly protein CpaB [Brevundimonas aveniformis]|uniref:Flp pilus assembly protein CpaB n=1 Tax=Brevundimonas aveniformis TaxID=370977 RepID=UPI0024929F5E|nr:Flp pilus assembly protein CpaB [Brevundimonas aveniformis]
MKPARIAVIAVAAVSAIGLALVVRAMGSGNGEAAPSAAAAEASQAQMAQVLVASRDLEVGDRIDDGAMTWRAFPAEAVNAAWIVEGAASIPTPRRTPAEGEGGEGGEDAAPDTQGDGSATAEVQRMAERVTGGGVRAQVVGAVVRERILAGEPIVASKLVRAGQSGFLAVVLERGMRAMSVPVTRETGAGGFILPGDRVDVIMSRRAEQGSAGADGTITATVLVNIRVLAVGETTEAGDQQTIEGTNATLEVGPREAEVLAFAQAQGELFLVLRSYADSREASGAAISTQTRADSGEARSVRIFRNGEVTEVPVG